MADTDNLPPTQSLALEVLAARYRLGETLWTFSTRHRPALLALEKRGLVTLMHGIVERTCRASLTEAGRAAVLLDGYGPPLGTAEWGVRFDGPPPYHPELSAYDTEGEARHQAEITPTEGGWSATLMHRQVGPWTEAPETEPEDGNRD